MAAFLLLGVPVVLAMIPLTRQPDVIKVYLVMAWTLALTALGYGAPAIGLFLADRKELPKRQRAYAEGQQRWEAMFHGWQRFYYCTACGSVYDPASGQWRPSDQMWELLTNA